MTTPAHLESAIRSPTPNVALADVLARIRAEYVEMPGLKLTAPQAGRLWALDSVTCDAALGALVNAKFLSRTPEGLFVIAATQDVEHMSALDPVGARQRSSVSSRGRQEVWLANLPRSRKSA